MNHHPEPVQRVDADSGAIDANQASVSLHLMAGVLRGEPLPWPADATPATFLEAASAHGVQPLLSHHLHHSERDLQWPETVRKPLREAARFEAMADLVRRREMQHVLAALEAAGAPGLLMKGAALAYLSYPHPALRPRCDADLLVRRDDRATVTGVMQALGYRPLTQTSGDLVMPQRTLVKQDRSGVWHSYDVHVKVANPVVFSELISFDEVAARSVAVPILGKPARALSPIDALLLACIHRVAHHQDSERLLWLYDIHLLASGMDGQAFEHFAALARDKHVRAVCMRGLSLAKRWLATDVPGAVLDTLSEHSHVEPSAAFIDGLSQVGVLRSDLAALSGWPARGRLIRQHLFPPAAYMRTRYAASGSVLLPALYALRAVRGVRRWFRRPPRVPSGSQRPAATHEAFADRSPEDGYGIKSRRGGHATSPKSPS